MDLSVLSDKFIKPNENVVSRIIGDKIILWQRIVNYLSENHPDFSEEWKYSPDGKFWFYRTLKKKKTIYWIRVLENNFRIAFWFGDKADETIEQSNLPEQVKNEFKNAKKIGNMGRSISIDMADASDLETVFELIELKIKIK